MSDMQKLQVGDTITTAEELDALPREVVARTSTGWTLITPVNSRVPFLEPDYPMTILYLPGHPPRPERVVKAEALPLDTLDAIVEHLMADKTRAGLIHANTLNQAFGRSARRLAAMGIERGAA